jgi:hypothetical protein
MFISKIAVRQQAFFSILAERYPNVVFSNADTASLNKYFNLKGVKSLDATATRALIESLPEDWEAAKALINNELSSQSSGSEKEAVAKALGVDVAKLDSKELISWLKSRYIDNIVNEMHPITESMTVVKKFLGIRSAILQKLSEDEGFRHEFSSKGFNEESLKDSLKLSSDDMIWMMDQYEYGVDTSIRTVGVELREGEYLGKLGEWNIWFPHTQETSAKIAGYDDVTKEPHTKWCTARTRGSNLYYHYVSRKDEYTDRYVHAFLFYIIKDNPKEDNDWLSLGFMGTTREEWDVRKNVIKPVFDGKYGGITVNRANKGLIRESFDRILGADTADRIFQMCQNHIEEELNHIHPAVEELRAFAKDPDAVRKALFNKNAEERKDFYQLITQHKPTEDVLVEFSRFADVEFIKQNFSKKWMQKPNARLKGKIPLDLALENAAKAEPYDLLENFSEEPWAQDYLDEAAKGAAEKNPVNFLSLFLDKPWAEDYIDTAAKNATEKEYIYFLIELSEKPWAKRYIDEAAKNAAEKEPYSFLYYLSDKPWAHTYLELAINNYFLDNYFNKATIFLYDFSDKPWANTPVDSIGGKTWLEYAEEILKAKEASSIDIKLKKLASFLLINKYPEELVKLKRLL